MRIDQALDFLLCSFVRKVPGVNQNVRVGKLPNVDLIMQIVRVTACKNGYSQSEIMCFEDTPAHIFFYLKCRIRTTSAAEMTVDTAVAALSTPTFFWACTALYC